MVSHDELPIIQVSHNDLDGIGCVIILKKALRMQGHEIDQFYRVGYEELEETLLALDRNCHLFLTDIGVSENLVELLSEFSQVTIIDHHQQSLVYAEKYSEYFETYVDIGHCATWLIVDWLEDNGFIIPPEELDWFMEWRYLVNGYDMWIQPMNRDCRRLNGLYTLSQRNVEGFVEEAMINVPFQMIDPKRDYIEGYLLNQDAYVDATSIHDISVEPGIKVGVAFADKHQSLIGDKMLTKLGYHVAYILNMQKGTASVRTGNSPYDSSKIGARYGGGGHKPAGGFQLKPEMIKAMIEMLNLPSMGYDLPLKDETV